MPAPAKPLAEYGAVQTWLKGLEEQWGEPPSDVAARVELLSRFCTFVEKESDEMIEEASREVDGGKRIRIKVRRFYSEKIEEFQAGIEGDNRARGRAANVIRSFFIHNGIFMQGGLQGQ